MTVCEAQKKPENEPWKIPEVKDLTIREWWQMESQEKAVSKK
jgi:hypothetical protein